MAKMMSKDSQIIVNMIRVQKDINKVLGVKPNETTTYTIVNEKNMEIAKDKSKVDLLTFYILKMFALRKNFSGKTKKSLSFFNDFKGACVLNSLAFCYPTLSDIEIVRIARSMADDLAYQELTERYEVCIKESVNNQI